MKITDKIQDIINEIKWEMKEERSYANIFLSNHKEKRTYGLQYRP